MTGGSPGAGSRSDPLTRAGPSGAAGAGFSVAAGAGSSVARRGLVALGDSITRGRGGAPTLGVHPQSWAQWLADALELPFHGLGADGATVHDVLRDQVPRVVGDYDIGTLYVGANDARGMRFEGEAYERDLRAAAQALAQRCATLLMLTIPLDLGRPRAGADVVTANAAIRRVGSEVGAVVVDLDDFAGARCVLPDAVHPTSLGMVAIAERAAAALACAGVAVPHRPRELASPRHDRRALARYGAWYGKQLARDWRRRAVERARYRLTGRT